MIGTDFALGLLSGLVIATLVVVTIAIFRKPVQRVVEEAGRKLDAVGPRPKGFVVIPQSEEDEAREAHISKNKKMGKDTPISELT